MKIKEVSKLTGVPADTLRFYERAGVIPRIPRNASGIREYTSESIAWIENAVCMRQAGLPIEALVEYHTLCSADPSFEKRLELLTSHRKQLEAQKLKLEDSIRRLDYKISRYEQAVKTGELLWDKTECPCFKTEK